MVALNQKHMSEGNYNVSDQCQGKDTVSTSSPTLLTEEFQEIPVDLTDKSVSVLSLGSLS